MTPSNVHVAVIDQLIQPRIHIKLPSIMTPCRKFISAKASAYAREVAARGKNDAFDQLPVVDDEGLVTGLVYFDQLQNLPTDAPISNYVVPLEVSGQLRIEDGISKAVRILHTQPASLVTDGAKVVGLVHRSDLNKHSSRTYFYLWLSDLEMMLAHFVAMRLPGNTWIEHLGEQAQVQVYGKMEVESRRNNSIDPIEYLDLSSLVKIIAKDQTLYEELGFKSRNETKNELGGLVDLRHDIMHPVRSLVSDDKSMINLAQREEKLRAITLEMKQILKRNRETVWVFGYGSLMWDGWEKEYGSTRGERALLPGYQRSFNKASTRNWGSKENPGPTLGLSPGDDTKCEGIAFEFPNSEQRRVLDTLTKREGKSFALQEKDIQLHSGEWVRALVPVNDTSRSTYIGRLPLAARVQMAKTAQGDSGKCMDYVRNIRNELQKMEVNDSSVEDFWKAIAEE